MSRLKIVAALATTSVIVYGVATVARRRRNARIDYRVTPPADASRYPRGYDDRD